MRHHGVAQVYGNLGFGYRFLQLTSDTLMSYGIAKPGFLGGSKLTSDGCRILMGVGIKWHATSRYATPRCQLSGRLHHYDSSVQPPVIRATVGGHTIEVSMEHLRTSLQLPLSKETRIEFPATLLTGCFKRMRYRGKVNGVLLMTRLFKQWRYLMHVIIMFLSPRRGGFGDYRATYQSAMVALETEAKKWLVYPRYIRMVLDRFFPSIPRTWGALPMSHMNKLILAHSSSIAKNTPAGLQPIDSPLFGNLVDPNYVALENDGWLKVDDEAEAGTSNAPLAPAAPAKRCRPATPRVLQIYMLASTSATTSGIVGVSSSSAIDYAIPLACSDMRQFCRLLDREVNSLRRMIISQQKHIDTQQRQLLTQHDHIDTLKGFINSLLDQQKGFGDKGLSDPVWFKVLNLDGLVELEEEIIEEAIIDEKGHVTHEGDSDKPSYVKEDDFILPDFMAQEWLI
ncbi:hypothetical protein QVD17_30830 [Tagetes erecta]|uniref:Uncharacterized protein n=1 Tax=Tagetes erecta TaxID=13708 RepID=A0AAD8K8M5_TARER|nr:hypothetical protein QVD17_30830 [Tagetes erecta]